MSFNPDTCYGHMSGCHVRDGSGICPNCKQSVGPAEPDVSDSVLDRTVVTDSSIAHLIRTVNARIPSSVTPATRIEIHPSDWLQLVDEIKRMQVRRDAYQLIAKKRGELLAEISGGCITEPCWCPYCGEPHSWPAKPKVEHVGGKAGTSGEHDNGV